MVEQLKAFDEAVNAVMDEASVDTYVLVTADHETGDLRYNGETGDAIKNSAVPLGRAYRQGCKVFRHLACSQPAEKNRQHKCGERFQATDFGKLCRVKIFAI